MKRSKAVCLQSLLTYTNVVFVLLSSWLSILGCELRVAQLLVTGYVSTTSNRRLPVIHLLMDLNMKTVGMRSTLCLVYISFAHFVLCLMIWFVVACEAMLYSVLLQFRVTFLGTTVILALFVIAL